jgi:dTDP-4-amino-4,6-dideoxygalactose transaminase
VFADVDERTFNLTPDSVSEAVSNRTRAVIPVHLYGQAADVDALRDAAPGIPILEDAAHAHGATLGSRPVGSLGEIAAFSFYPSKLLGALGDGGIATTSDDGLAARLRQLRYMGQTTTKHDHEAIGYQERLDELQAAFLRVKLRHLDEQIEGRRGVAARYDSLLAPTPLETPLRDATGRHVYYMYTVLAPDRDRLANHLSEHGIGTQVIYPRLVPDQKAYHGRPHRVVGLPVARRLGSQLLCLPMFAELTDGEIDRVCETIADFYKA